MKVERGSEGENHSSDEEQIETAHEIQENKFKKQNLDIEYLLKYINLNQEEELGLIDSLAKQSLNATHNNSPNANQTKNQIIQPSEILNYVIENSCYNKQPTKQTLNLISTIDAGIKFITKIKRFMMPKPNSPKDKAKSSLLLGLFLPAQNDTKTNHKAENIELSSSKMNNLLRDKQIQLLLARTITFQKTKITKCNDALLKHNGTGTSEATQFRFLLSQSLAQHFQQSQSKGVRSKLQQLENQLFTLQKTVMSSKKLNKSANNEECSFSYQKVSKIWTLVDEITKK